MSDLINDLFNLSGDGMTRRDWVCGAIGAVCFFGFIWGMEIFAIACGVA